MPYDIQNDPYINPQTGVLYNLLNIDNEYNLENAEAQITSVEISALLVEGSSVIVGFDIDSLCKIHELLFGEIFDWAGEFRTIDMEKESTRFAHAPYIVDQIKKLLGEFADEKYLAGLDRKDFIDRAAHYYSELNVIHPFREGNGRTLRTFLSLIATNAGWNIAWDKMDSDENIRACIAGYMGDEKPLRVMLEKLIELKHLNTVTAEV
jgi:cell filamentation protein